MRTIGSREIFTKKCRQQQNFNSDHKEAWHYNHVTFTTIAKNFMLYCRLIYMLSMLYVRLVIKVKVGIPESFKVGWYRHKITGSSHLNWLVYVPTYCVHIATLNQNKRSLLYLSDAKIKTSRSVLSGLKSRGEAQEFLHLIIHDGEVFERL